METNRIEYKREITSFIEKEIIAFLNYKEGGIIYIGIEDNGTILGLKNADEEFHILPDMEFTAEIKTGSRKVIDYAVKPIIIALEQSFGER